MTASTVQPGEKDTVEISSDLHNATVGVTAHFRSGDASYKGKTTGSGEAQVGISVPANELPGTVDVDVLVGSIESCHTSFTIV
jgi:predicted component of type VI protein secretion system